MQKSFMRNQPHLHFCRNGKLPNASSCKGSIHRNGSFFSIYVSRTLTTFSIFSHIEILFFLHCILPFFRFCRSCILLMCLHASKACIFHRGKVEGINVGKKGLFFFGKVCHMNEVQGLYQVKGF